MTSTTMTPSFALGPSLETASFERFCLTAGIEAIEQMLCEDAQELTGKPHSRGGDRVGQRWGRTKGKIGRRASRRDQSGPLPTSAAQFCWRISLGRRRVLDGITTGRTRFWPTARQAKKPRACQDQTRHSRTYDGAGTVSVAPTTPVQPPPVGPPPEQLPRRTSVAAKIALPLNSSLALVMPE
jgi:hypothetical protein